MKTLTDVLLEGKIAYQTLIKYRDLGLLPRPQIVRRGRKGTESLYPDDVITRIQHIEKLKEDGLTLPEIAEIIRDQRQAGVSESHAVTSDSNGLDSISELERRYPDHKLAVIEMGEDSRQADGSVTVRAKIVMRPKKAEE
jgi:DNA-binding transcriptional MerR regulator